MPAKRRGAHLSDHVIIAGYGVNGRNLAKVLKHLKIPHIVIETNPFTVSAEKKRGEHIIFGDASKPEVLEHGKSKRPASWWLQSPMPLPADALPLWPGQLNPSIHVIVRTRYILEVEPLFKLGVNEVIPEEFETSVEILSQGPEEVHGAAGCH